MFENKVLKNFFYGSAIAIAVSLVAPKAQADACGDANVIHNRQNEESWNWWLSAFEKAIGLPISDEKAFYDPEYCAKLLPTLRERLKRAQRGVELYKNVQRTCGPKGYSTRAAPWKDQKSSQSAADNIITIQKSIRDCEAELSAVPQKK